MEIAIKAMKKDPQIELSIKLAFEDVVNQNNRTAKALVLYLDEMFKKDFKTIQEIELNEILDKVIHIFRYLLDKDVFEGFYKNSFAKRLLDNRHNNEDAERALVLKLKEECGF
jgi:cullin-4